MNNYIHASSIDAIDFPCIVKPLIHVKDDKSLLAFIYKNLVEKMFCGINCLP